MQFITLQDCLVQDGHPLNLETVLAKMRNVFSQVFARHYKNIIRQALKNKNNPENRLRLQGFSDLEANYFPGGFQNYPFDTIKNEDPIESKLKALLQGAGFADEVAFIRAYKSGQCRTEGLDADDLEKLDKYHATLATDHRQLREVNFVAIFDDQNKKCCGFVIYHIIRTENETILHARQAAMLIPNRGYAMTVARFLTDRYPHAYYEANQRAGNIVPMKDKLLAANILKKTESVLGYNPTFYFGLKGNQTALLAMMEYLKKGKRNDQQLANMRYRASKRFFSAVQFQRETFTDDMQLNSMMYIKK